MPAGSTVAIVGPTGSGKTTLVEPAAAVVGRAARDALRRRRTTCGASRSPSLRGAIGFVPQESFLFSDTVRENVGFGLAQPDAEAVARVEWAAGVAQLSKDLRDFPQGFETPVGERGITLSGGQKQRAALARALASRPAHPGARRRALGGRHRDRGADPRGAARGAPLADDVPGLAPRLDREGRRPDRGAARRARSSSAARTRSCVARGGFYADLHRRQLLEEEIDGEDAA